MVTLQHCTFGCSEQLIGADTHPAHFESSKKAPKPCRRHATTALVSDNTDVRFHPLCPRGSLHQHGATRRGFPAHQEFKLASSTCVARHSMLDQPCTSSLGGDSNVEQLPSLARQIAGQYYRYFGFHFLVVLSFFESLMFGLPLAPMPLGFAQDATALVYQRACQY